MQRPISARTGQSVAVPRARIQKITCLPHQLVPALVALSPAEFRRPHRHYLQRPPPPPSTMPSGQRTGVSGNSNSNSNSATTTATDTTTTTTKPSAQEGDSLLEDAWALAVLQASALESLRQFPTTLADDFHLLDVLRRRERAARQQQQQQQKEQQKKEQKKEQQQQSKEQQKQQQRAGGADELHNEEGSGNEGNADGNGGAAGQSLGDAELDDADVDFYNISGVDLMVS